MSFGPIRNVDRWPASSSDLPRNGRFQKSGALLQNLKYQGSCYSYARQKTSQFIEVAKLKVRFHNFPNTKNRLKCFTFGFGGGAGFCTRGSDWNATKLFPWISGVASLAQCCEIPCVRDPTPTPQPDKPFIRHKASWKHMRQSPK